MHYFQLLSKWSMILALMLFWRGNSVATEGDRSFGFTPLTAKDPFNRYGLEDRLDEKIAVSSKTVYEIVRRDYDNSRPAALFYRVKFPFGFEEKRPAAGKSIRRFDFNPTGLTLRGTLDMLIRDDPDYTWEEVDGVVNFLPRISALNIIVPSFIAKEVDIYSAADLLRRQLGQSEHGRAISRGIGLLGLMEFYRSGGTRINIELRNATLRECLNELIRQDGTTDWSLHYLEVKGKPGFNIHLEPRMSKLKEVYLRAKEKHDKESEEWLLREGFKKGKNGVWSKPGPKRRSGTAPEVHKGKLGQGDSSQKATE